MSQISYETFMSRNQSDNTSGKQKNFVSYFGLQQDGQEAVVRIMHDSIEDFDIMLIHPTIINNKHRRVNCLRTPKDPFENCPFCAAQKQLQQKLYIHVIEYVRDETGKVIGIPKIWERSSAYITTLKNLLDEYGPLSECIFKIKRNGAPGDVDTTYSIMYASPAIYSNEIYIKNPDAFKDIKALGSVVLDKNFDELKALIEGESGSGEGDPSRTIDVSQPQSVPASSSAPAYSQSLPEQVSSTNLNEQPADNMMRPRRFY